MNCRKIYCVLFIFLCVFIPIKTFSQSITYDHIVFFGDSLSDDGNLYSADFGELPKSPPYSQGRFSNGVVWSETVAAYFHDTTNGNYAVGGETVYLHDPFSGYLPYSLTASIDSYLLHTAYEDRTNTLFIIWIGANDYLNGATDVDQTTTGVIQAIQSDIENLISHGAVNFIVLNLPDLSRTPLAKESGTGANLGALAISHNKKLAAAIADIQSNYSNVNIRLFDIDSLFNRLLDDTVDMNKQYHTHITNITDSCWTGGYSVKKNEIEKTIKAEPRVTLKKNTKFNVSALSESIAKSPALSVAYNVGQHYAANDATPCNDPDDYLFWDEVHPTAAVHTILSQAILSFINQAG